MQFAFSGLWAYVMSKTDARAAQGRIIVCKAGWHELLQQFFKLVRHRDMFIGTWPMMGKGPAGCG